MHLAWILPIEMLGYTLMLPITFKYNIVVAVAVVYLIIYVTAKKTEYYVEYFEARREIRRRIPLPKIVKEPKARPVFRRKAVPVS